VSKGSRRQRAAGSATEDGKPNEQVWIFSPKGESKEQRTLRLEMAQQGQARNWTVIVRVARLCKVDGGPEHGRPYLLIEPRDAGELYSAVHRHPTLVLATAACSVRRNPSVNPSRYRDLVSLHDFVRYKAHFGTLRGHSDVRRYIEEFEEWVGISACDGLHDPRVLPLHIFDNTEVWLNLDTPEQANTFTARFGPAARRKDIDERSWAQATALHGGDTLSVAGVSLLRGFHWDVIRGSGGQTIITTHEIWRLENKKSYSNIYPDGYVRSGSRDGGGISRLVWSAGRLDTPMPHHQAGHCETYFSSSYYYHGLTGDGVGGPRTEETLRGSTSYAPPRSSLASHVAGRSGRPLAPLRWDCSPQIIDQLTSWVGSSQVVW
jgi:hypothetical protein